MTADGAAGNYTDIVLFLATAGVAVPIFHRWKLSPILGFLGAGVILGPFGLGALQGELPWLRYLTIGNSAAMAQLAEFGVVFLLFAIGLELSWERLWTMRRLVFGLGGLQVAVCTAAIAAAAMLLGQDPVAAVLLGSALALSSTAIVLPLLAEQKRQFSRPGRAAFAVLLLQDLAVAPLLVTIAVMGGQRGTAFSPGQLLAFAPAVLGLVVLIVLGRLVLRPMMRSVARADSEELFVAASLLVVLGAGLVAAMSGLSMALGAFVAGLLLAETEYRKQVEKTVEPFKGLLLGLFFVSIGIGLDLSLLAARPLLIVGLMVGLLAINGAVVFALGRLFGLGARAAAEAALLLAAGGEFAFVLLHAAVREGLLDGPLVQTILVSSTLSMFCIPLLAAAGAAVGRARSRSPRHVLPDADTVARPRVLVVGYGRVGRLVADMLTRHGIPWTAVERVPKLIEAARREGHDVFFGDASRGELLQRFGLDSAPAVVVTMDSLEATEEVVAAARALQPALPILARARDAAEAQRLYELGVTEAVPETIEASLQLSEALLARLGIPMERLAASIHQRRDEFRRKLAAGDAVHGGGRRLRRR
ncbi:MAG: cation:proton antiporter [Reyranella sp.]|nr:cation:proton antiporter [Reyranella sp.]